MMLIFSPFHTLSRLFNNCIELKGVEIKLTPPAPLCPEKITLKKPSPIRVKK